MEANCDWIANQPEIVKSLRFGDLKYLLQKDRLEQFTEQSRLRALVTWFQEHNDDDDGGSLDKFNELIQWINIKLIPDSTLLEETEQLPTTELQYVYTCQCQRRQADVHLPPSVGTPSGFNCVLWRGHPFTHKIDGYIKLYTSIK